MAAAHRGAVPASGADAHGAGADGRGAAERTRGCEAAGAGSLRSLVRLRGEPPEWCFGRLRLRRYRRGDHATVLALHREGLAQVGLRPGDGIYYEHDLFRMEEIYLRDGGEFLVGELDGEIVAMGGLRAADPAEGAAEMVRLRVRPDVQRCGYGSAVVRALEQRAAEYGYRLLRADTTELQEPALRLYRRFGWTETRRAVIGGIVNIYLEKRLR
ncbi:hypothetical protein Acsp04_38180 [Actinomadura sp. NBRC 104425]|uniref:GNAT family N-acetyltransferase n=1 Tax=Actinomadura sp. NBRC 104425 TaxID=3032204 RepID=UPI0024A250BF|nr:GNAT family N-acetyltransferase [Actinomadura sp. NBRC 104425]GLZ13583.1 hypothetical protein Acsp04_38180 [Actinomadura sp. NBRC 104425]